VPGLLRDAGIRTLCSSDSQPCPSSNADSWPADRVLAILNDFSKELKKIKDPSRQRTGEVDFRVNVLNPGDSDGVI